MMRGEEVERGSSSLDYNYYYYYFYNVGLFFGFSDTMTRRYDTVGQLARRRKGQKYNLFCLQCFVIIPTLPVPIQMEYYY